MRRLAPVAALVAIAAAFSLGRGLRAHLPAEATPAALQAWMAGLGWTGMAAFVGVMTFRQFLLLPSAVVLTVGGLCFGPALGTMLGSAGILLSAVMKFSLARLAGRGWMPSGSGAPRGRLGLRIDRLGPAVIAASTAHPLGPLAPFHWAAGLSSISLGAFLVAVTLGAPVRAFAYSLFGAALLDTRSHRFVVAAVVLAAVVLLPLAHPAARRWIGDRG